MPSRRSFIRSLCATLPVFPLERMLAGVPLGVEFINVAKNAGLHAKTIFGAEQHNKYLLETTGCGVAFIDFDDDGWLDIFFVNGTRFEGAPEGADQPPVQEQSRRNFHRRHTEIGLGPNWLGARSLRGRLQQRWARRPLRNLLGRLRAISQ